MKAIKFLVILATTIFASVSMASPIDMEIVKSLEGEYVGSGSNYNGGVGQSCSVEIKIKRNKISFKVVREGIIHYRRDKGAKYLSEYSTDKYDLEKFAQNATGNLEISNDFSYNEFYNFESIRYYNRFFVHDGLLSGIRLSYSATGHLDFFRGSRESIEAECFNLKKVR